MCSPAKTAKKQKPEEGADNLYVYEPDPAHPGAYHTVFVATLLTPAEATELEKAEAKEQKEIDEQGAATYKHEEEEILREYHSGQITSEREEELLAEAYTRYEDFTRSEGSTIGTRGPSGTLAEDRSVWQRTDQRPAQATPEGRFLLFPSSADLPVPQLFEYAAETEKLTRVSIGQDGEYHADGAVETFSDAPQIPLQYFRGIDPPTSADFKLAVSADGSSVFFTSAAGLTPEALEGDTSVYEYREGNVYLISGGHDASLDGHEPTVHLFGIDPGAGDALFTTTEQLVPQDDGETQVALYDAREQGGFPAPALAPGCSGETCRGAPATTPQLQLPETVNQPGGENLPPPVEPKPAAKALTTAQKLAKALKACRSKRNKKKRASCEATARRRYGTKTAAKKSATTDSKQGR